MLALLKLTNYRVVFPSSSSQGKTFVTTERFLLKSSLKCIDIAVIASTLDPLTSYLDRTFNSSCSFDVGVTSVGGLTTADSLSSLYRLVWGLFCFIIC